MTRLIRCMVVPAAFVAAVLTAEAAPLLPKPSRPTSFPLKRPAQPGVFFTWGSYAGLGDTPFGLHNVVQVAGGSGHWLALLADGNVRTWPENSWSFGRENRVPQGLRDVVQIAAGESFSLALKRDGRVVAWGKMGISTAEGWTQTDRDAFVPRNVSKIVQVAAGGNHVLALTSNGRVVAWGDNGSGQCEDLGLTDIVQVAAGGQHSLALRRNGTVVAWGYRTSYPWDDRVVVPPRLNDVTKIAAGREHSVALLRNGRVVGWGSNRSGQAPRDFGISNAIDIAAGDTFTAVTLRNRQVRVFSSDSSARPPRGLGAVLQVAGGRPSLALKESRLVAWGKDGSEDVLSVVPDVGRAVEIAAGRNHALARMSDGKVAAWGGYDSRAANMMPANLPRAKKVVAGPDHSAIITQDGKVRAWAHQTEQSESRVPAGVSQIVDLAAGDDHLLALRKDGRVLMWTIDGNFIKAPNLPERIKQVGVGSSYNFGLGRSGVLYRWANYPNAYYGNPTVVRGNVASFAASHRVSHLLALDKLGNISAFDSSGRQDVSRETTVPPGIKKSLKVAVGSSYCLVLQRDGTLRAWGDSALTDYVFGRIGPAPLGLKRVSAIAVGGDFALALRQPPPRVAK